VVAAGTNSCNSSNRFGAISTFNECTPVTLPPGRLRLATRPSLTESPAVLKTIGIVRVSVFAASAAGALPGAAITVTWRRTRSAASTANRSFWPSAHVAALDVTSFA
jgi:hypothetical protein